MKFWQHFFFLLQTVFFDNLPFRFFDNVMNFQLKKIQIKSIKVHGSTPLTLTSPLSQSERTNCVKTRKLGHLERSRKVLNPIKTSFDYAQLDVKGTVFTQPGSRRLNAFYLEKR